MVPPGVFRFSQASHTFRAKETKSDAGLLQELFHVTICAEDTNDFQRISVRAINDQVAAHRPEAQRFVSQVFTQVAEGRHQNHAQDGFMDFVTHAVSGIKVIFCNVTRMSFRSCRASGERMKSLIGFPAAFADSSDAIPQRPVRPGCLRHV